MPKIPLNGQIEAHIRGHEKKGLPAADANFLNSKLGIDLVNKFNRWWVVK